MELSIWVSSKSCSLDFPYINNHFILTFTTDSYLFAIRRCTVNSKTQEFVSQKKKSLGKHKIQNNAPHIFNFSFLFFLVCYAYFCESIISLSQVNLHAWLISPSLINLYLLYHKWLLWECCTATKD